MHNANIWAATWLALAALSAPIAARAQSADERAAADVVHEMTSFDAVATRAGRLAVHRASAADIRRYGDRLMRDAHRLEALVQRYAHTHGVASPHASARSGGAASDVHADELAQQLTQLSGVAFEQVLLTETASSAQHAIMQLANDRSRTGDADLQSLIDTATDLLQQEHTLAISLERAR